MYKTIPAVLSTIITNQHLCILMNSVPVQNIYLYASQNWLQTEKKYTFNYGKTKQPLETPDLII